MLRKFLVCNNEVSIDNIALQHANYSTVQMNDLHDICATTYTQLLEVPFKQVASMEHKVMFVRHHGTEIGPVGAGREQCNQSARII